LYLIAAAAMVLIALAGLAVNVSDHRVSAPSKHLAQRVVNSQEEERARVAQELYDGIIQVLVSEVFSSKPLAAARPGWWHTARQTGPCRGVTVAGHHTPQAWAGPAQRALTEVRQFPDLRRRC
jgi:two-component system NarL family sensor kinase